MGYKCQVCGLGGFTLGEVTRRIVVFGEAFYLRICPGCFDVALFEDHRRDFGILSDVISGLIRSREEDLIEKLKKKRASNHGDRDD